MQPESRRRPVVAIVGSASKHLPESVVSASEELGRKAVDAGFRIVTGGLGGVMLAASRGARSSSRWHSGDVLGVLPSYDRTSANGFVDVVIPTGLQYGRNVVVVSMADVVIAVRGGAGTLSELALAWQLDRPIVALCSAGGWAARLAGERIDDRGVRPIAEASTPAEAIQLALAALQENSLTAGDIGSGSRTSR